MRPGLTRVTTAIVAVTVVAWVLVALFGKDQWAALAGGFIPARVFGPPLPGALPVWLTPLSATLVHAGLLHLAFNMLMLGFCGKLVEVALGGRGLAALYLAGAYAGALGQYLTGPHSLVPMVGASGAISAVIAAYAILYGQRGRLPAGWRGTVVNVVWLAAAWIGLQILVGFGTSGTGLNIAIAAHVGGFFAGLAAARPLLLLRYRTA